MRKLYVNVYLVTRHYGGPQEGGWWYDAGEPLASIPVAAESAKGQTYFVGLGKSVHVQACTMCEGTGECEKEDEGTGETYKGRCEFCGLIPSDLAHVANVLQAQTEAFKDDAGRREEIRVSLEDHFARNWPESTPQYE
jgi:hypothetical protein